MEVITHIGVNKVTAVVTGNAANMSAAWDILEAESSAMVVLLILLTYL